MLRMQEGMDRTEFNRVAKVTQSVEEGMQQYLNGEIDFSELNRRIGRLRGAAKVVQGRRLARQINYRKGSLGLVHLGENG